jgi:hypothetical protein
VQARSRRLNRCSSRGSDPQLGERIDWSPTCQTQCHFECHGSAKIGELLRRLPVLCVWQPLAVFALWSYNAWGSLLMGRPLEPEPLAIGAPESPCLSGAGRARQSTYPFNTILQQPAENGRITHRPGPLRQREATGGVSRRTSRRRVRISFFNRVLQAPSPWVGPLVLGRFCGLLGLVGQGPELSVARRDVK